MNNTAQNTTWFPPLLRFVFTLVLGFSLIFFVMRIAFWIVFEPSHNPLTVHDLLKSFWLGWRFDLRIAVAMLLPLFFTGWLPFLNPLRNRYARMFWLTVLSAGFAVVALVYILDFGHYAYLSKRLDFTAMRFLEDASISAQMVWESYPVVWITLGWVTSVAVVYVAMKKLADHFARQRYAPSPWWKTAIIGFAAFFLMFVGAYSKLSQYPLRWSDAAFSKHPFAAQLTYNPVHYIFDTWKNGRITYDVNATRKAYPLIADFLEVDHPDAETLNYLRQVPAKKGIGKKPNVVLIIVESFAAYKTSLSGNPLDPTPNVRKIAEKGWYFRNFFTPSTGTARSVYTTITGMPDVELHGTSSRNPLIVDQHSVMNDFDGYEKYYFIGGSASWGNIRGILTKNIDNLHLYEEEDYDSPRNDVWGISDLDLFMEANKVLSKETKPFIAIIQTSGDHRPYTIPPPEKSRGFTVIHPGDEKVKRYGFDNEKEFNAYRLMDHSIGYFTKLAKEAGWDRNTIFAFWGDHGLDGFAGEHTYKGESTSELGLGSHRVPFVVWSPGLIRDKKVIDTVVSEVDILPTMAGLCGEDYNDTTMGRDMFDPKYEGKRQAFTMVHVNPPRIGMIDEKYYFKMTSDGKNAGLYDIYSDTPTKDLTAQHPEEAVKLRRLTEAYYKTVQYMMYHNKRSDMRRMAEEGK